MTDCDHVTLDKDIEREALCSQARRYEVSVQRYQLAESHGQWYYNGAFYPSKEAGLLRMYEGKEPVENGPEPIKYSATEDLMFCYAELFKIYRRIFELEEDQ